MSEVDPSVVHEGVTGLLSICMGFMTYILKRRDKQIDSLEEGQKAQAVKQSALELEMAKHYATKDDLRVMFQEAQNTNRESSARLEKQIDATNNEIKLTNTKIDGIRDILLDMKGK